MNPAHTTQNSNVRQSSLYPAGKALVAAVLASSGCASLAQTVAVHYFPRRPYVVMENNALVGLTGSVVTAALKAAGIEMTVHDTPASRFLALIRRNEGLDCGVGWFKNPEREAIGKFTKPLYQDEAMVALTYANNSRIKPSDTVESVLANPDLTLLVKQSFSYGKTLDALMEKLQPRREQVATENLHMIRMIQAKRADYMWISPEESTAAIIAAGLQPGEFKQIKLANMPPGEFRYLWCSKAVPDAVIAKLNDAIR